MSKFALLQSDLTGDLFDAQCNAHEFNNTCPLFLSILVHIHDGIPPVDNPKGEDCSRIPR